MSPEEMASMPGMAGGVVNDGVTPGLPDPLHQVDRWGSLPLRAWKARYKEAVERMDQDLAVVRQAMPIGGSRRFCSWLLIMENQLYDHQELLHGDGFYDTVVNVPLLIHVPTLSGSRDPISALTSHVDIMPTLLSLVGAVSPANIDGRSLLPLMTGESTSIRKIALSEGGCST